MGRHTFDLRKENYSKLNFIHLVCLFCCCCFMTEFLSVSLIVLEFTLWTIRPQTERSAYLCVPSAGIKGLFHHALMYLFCGVAVVVLGLSFWFL